VTLGRAALALVAAHLGPVSLEVLRDKELSPFAAYCLLAGIVFTSYFE
jgi:hypothetical protein